GLTEQDANRKRPGRAVRDQSRASLGSAYQHHGTHQAGGCPDEVAPRAQRDKEDGRGEPHPVVNPAHWRCKLSRDTHGQPRLKLTPAPVAGPGRPQASGSNSDRTGRAPEPRLHAEGRENALDRIVTRGGEAADRDSMRQLPYDRGKELDGHGG